MILLSSAKLRKALVNDSLDSWAKAKYIIFVIAMYSMSGPFYWFVPSFGEKQPLSYALCSFPSQMLNILLIIYGAKKCFLTNKKGDGKDFIGRFSVLYVPLTFQIIPLVFFFLIMAGIVYILPVDKDIRQEIFLYLIRLLPIVITYLFYLFLNRSFEKLAEMIRKRDETSYPAVAENSRETRLADPPR